MTLKFSQNESPVPSSKLRKLAIMHYSTTDRKNLTSDDVKVGTILYDEDQDAYYKVTQATPSVQMKKLGKTLGAGGMKVNLKFGFFLEVDPSDKTGYANQRVILFAESFDSQTTGDTGAQSTDFGVAFETADGGAVATFADSMEYRGVEPITFGGKEIGLVVIEAPISAEAEFSAANNTFIRLNASNTKIEILDAAVVKATISIPNNRSTDIFSATSRSIGSQLNGIVDLGGHVFTDFRIKAYISTTVGSTTNLTAHKHYYFASLSSETDTTPIVRIARAQVEVKP
ncbi:MAG: hypothetical protein QXU32_06675 [Nitrososphaerales archaeon]